MYSFKLLEKNFISYNMHQNRTVLDVWVTAVSTRQLNKSNVNHLWIPGLKQFPPSSHDGNLINTDVTFPE